ncbi:hypothetical protein EVAR_51226_1 [Eumeta japonica]|uniref:RAD3-like helicase DEAD domain-containing protein n=1 Tax=Eumeta variegata TaxID=151549 RepID=A0A4C1ZES2_EUMVA|nr:hypothetical protein EVAR_51226_1 [Eumeta japonica]
MKGMWGDEREWTAGSLTHWTKYNGRSCYLRLKSRYVRSGGTVAGRPYVSFRLAAVGGRGVWCVRMNSVSKAAPYRVPVVPRRRDRSPSVQSIGPPFRIVCYYVTIMPRLRSFRCLDMQRSKTKTTCVGEDGKVLKKTKGNHCNSCPYYNQSNIHKMTQRILVDIMDIEDLVQNGKALKACPYYASRHALDDAQVSGLGLKSESEGSLTWSHIVAQQMNDRDVMGSLFIRYYWQIRLLIRASCSWKLRSKLADRKNSLKEQVLFRVWSGFSPD